LVRVAEHPTSPKILPTSVGAPRRARFPAQVSPLRPLFRAAVRGADRPHPESAVPQMNHLSYSEAVTRLKAIKQELRELRAKIPYLSEHDKLRAAELATDVLELQKHADHMRWTSGSQSRGDFYDRDSIREPDSIEDYRRGSDPWDMREVKLFGDPARAAAELRSRALSCIERMSCASHNVRQAATNIIEEWDSKDSRLARQCIVTSQPAYMRAWSKLACNKPHSLTVDEQRALNEVEEFRAMSLTDVQGGYLIPFQLDPTVIVTSTFVRSDLRQAARVVVATGDVWNGVTSQNVSWSFQAEGAEVADNSPPFGQPSIPNFMARGFIPISIEAMADEQNVAQEVGRLLANGKLDLEGLKFIQGSGLNEPTGIITSLSISANSGSVVTTANSGVFALADFYNLQGSLPAHYRPNASWLANNLIYNKIRQFDTAGGAAFWTNLTTDRPAQLYARDALEAEAMSGVVASGNMIGIYGDLSQFVITDRIGMAVEFIPHLFSKNDNRPTGTRGWFAYYRTGSDLVNATGVKVLKVA
jgi:HK97 family phage major capsid protein